MQEAFETPALISALTSYSYARHAKLTKAEVESLEARRWQQPGTTETSLLFLQIYAAADYFSLNETLMQHVPSVHVDIILDPYLLNAFPKSLLPTAGFITLVAAFALALAPRIYAFLLGVANRPSTIDPKKTS